MTSESRDEAPTFEKVARLIAEEEFDVEWLAGGLRGWIWPQERYPASARKYGHGLGDLMSDWGLFGFLTDERLGPGSASRSGLSSETYFMRYAGAVTK